MRPYYSSKIQSRLELHSNPQNAINRDTYMVHAISLHLVLRYTFTILHHTSPYFNWNLKLGTGITGICRFAGRFFISNPWYCATPLRPAVARCPVESRRLIPGESGPRDTSHGAVPWLGFTWGHPMGIPVGCLPSSSMSFALRFKLNF